MVSSIGTAYVRTRDNDKKGDISKPFICTIIEKGNGLVSNKRQTMKNQLTSEIKWDSTITINK